VTIDRLLRNFTRLVQSLVDATDTPVSQLPLLADDERSIVLRTWNPEPDPTAAARTIAECFQDCVKRRPDAIAVADGSVTLTYAELNARANALADVLLPYDIGSDDVVAIAAERSVWTIVGMLGILKAGGAYLPLDPAYPHDQLRTMVAAAEPRVLLTRGSVGAAFAGAPNVVDLDALDLGAGLPFDPPSDDDADALAYLMFTSGSTGRAKGVLITHRGVVNLVRAPETAIAAADVVAQMSNLSFDGATYEIWGALLNGARLEIIDRETMLDPRALAAALRERCISVAFLTSALLRHVARAEPAAFATLRCLIAGGEVVDPATVRAIFAHGKPARMLNGYGPSETTTFATAYEITLPPHEPIPIGRPLRNIEAFVLDPYGNAVPIGVRGQLHIGGLGVARGYLNAPELTAQRFVPHPRRRDGSRVYATGDIARFLADGSIEFCGRADRQVKLRGFRIELDDVEAALAAQPGVEAAAVTVRERSAGMQQLVAYVVQTGETPRDAAQWRSDLQAQLPAYMVPDIVVGVDALPLTPNGKIDLTALEAAFAGERPGAQFQVLETAVESAAERAIARIFADVLGIARAAATDDFFARGGHSLLAAQAIARIGDRFGVEISLRDFFAEPTPAALARRIGGAPLRPALAAAQPDIRVAHMSDAEVDALVAEALGQ
jgi:amino acid adenylation domain-containing protein